MRILYAFIDKHKVKEQETVNLLLVLFVLFIQNFSDNRVENYEHSRKVERALEGTSLAGGHCGLAVTAEIAIPVAELGV